MSQTNDLPGLLAACHDDADKFNAAILGRPPYWWRQVEICRAVREFSEVYVPSGNAVGKTYLQAGLLLWFLSTRKNCLVVSTAPTQVQLEEVLWKEIGRAYRGSLIPIGGRALKSPLKIDLGDGWQAIGYSTTSTERFSGHHSPDLLAIVDEASGVIPEIFEAIDSLNPSRTVYTGNPLRPYGEFYERVEKVRSGANPIGRVIKISSLESPDIHLPRSPRGMADATWLDKCRYNYGDTSIWWKCHVLGQFPDEASDQVFPAAWLDACTRAVHVAKGKRRLAIDLATGTGGDRTVLCVRDDGGIYEFKSSRDWNFARTADEAAQLAAKYRVASNDVTWDAEGIGHDFGNRLTAVGLAHARPYRGSLDGGPRFMNMRALVAWRARQRIDPQRQIESPLINFADIPAAPWLRADPAPKIWRDQQPFAIRSDQLQPMRRELINIRYELVGNGKIRLEPKEDLVKRLGHSPDFSDAFQQTFAYLD